MSRASMSSLVVAVQCFCLWYRTAVDEDAGLHDLRERVAIEIDARIRQRARVGSSADV